MDYQKNHQIQAAIRQFKYKFSQPLGQFFAKVISQKLNELNKLDYKIYSLIPIPLHPKRMAYRGFNQALVMADEIVKVQPELKVYDCIKRTKNTSQQAKLSKKERLINLESAFTLKGASKKVDGGHYFLVDDVCTTGATLESASKLLKENGAKKVYGLVLARAFK